MASKKILIVGGGIAGLTLAISLTRRGIACEMIESNPQWGVYGVGIILQSNALRALETLGLAQRCLSAGFPYSTTRYYDAKGQFVRERTKPNLSGDRFASSTGVLRPVLHDILRTEALALNVPVRLGLTVSRLEQAGARVDVTFSDASVGSYDLVVGADGVRSEMRRTVFGAEYQPTFMGQACWRFTAERPAEVPCAVMYTGTQTQAGLIPLTQDKMYLLLLTAEPGNPRLERDSLRGMLAERLGEYGGLIGELARSLPDSSDIVYSPLEPLLMPAPWHRGRVVLVGDAAHATTPHIAQGASMAFEDAVVLSELLGEAPSIDQALQAYTARRWERCRLIVHNSLQIGRWQLQAWEGKPDPQADIVTLSNQTLEALRAPI
jgi:2-polyprenyl-6-methoxyphenol hydroxylase-like FAD-dependent oxidoreductase